MTSDVRFEVRTRCDRTGREIVQYMTLEAAKLHHAEMRLKRINADKIRTFLLALDGPLPDLVVACNDNIVVLENVSGMRSKSIPRLLYMLTRSKLFPEPVRRARNENKEQTR